MILFLREATDTEQITKLAEPPFSRKLNVGYGEQMGWRREVRAETKQKLAPRKHLGHFGHFLELSGCYTKMFPGERNIRSSISSVK